MLCWHGLGANSMYAGLLALALLAVVVNNLVGLLVITTPNFATIRRWILIVIGGIAWALYGYLRHPFVPSSNPLLSFLEYPFRALFAADVFKHVLVGAFIFWFAFRAAAIYLDDIFELQDIRIAEKFIRQSAFASQYNVIEVKDGGVALKDRKSPIFLIGGPGKVKVYLENAAIFEPIDGVPNVIGPTTPGDGPIVLESFERFRDAIDLRDQVPEDFSVEGRTKDGIPVQAKDMRVIFSVLRDGLEPTLAVPYPYIPEAIENLVYTKSRELWTDAMKPQINLELGAFIARHTLSEFLALIEPPELAIEFVPRPDITELFYDDDEFGAEIMEQGIELRWIGIGTWTFPSEIIPERHLRAWQISSENLAMGSAAALAEISAVSRLEQLVEILRDTPCDIFNQINPDDGPARTEYMAALVNGYRGKLRVAKEIYIGSDQVDSLEYYRISKVLLHLYNIVTVYAANI